MIGKRIELDGRNVERSGQQFVSGRGLFKDGYTDVHRIEPHGFSSQPVKGAKAFLIAPNGPDQAYVVGGEHPSHRPNGIPGGGSALYDAHGNIIRMVMADGVSIDVAGNAYTIRKAGVSFKISGEGVDVDGGYLKVNGVRVDDTHTHGGVSTGSGFTAIPKS